MNTFFFHLKSPDGIERDEVGLRVADLEEAYLEARRSAPAIAAEILCEGSDPMKFSFVIENASGEIVTVPLADLMRKADSHTRMYP